jgi:hypothetical protein
MSDELENEYNEALGTAVSLPNFNLSGCSHSGTIKISGL